MEQDEEEERKEAIEAFAAELMDNDDVGPDGINLGSEEECYVLRIDEWAIDEVNDIINAHGFGLTIDHGQVFLNKL